MPDYPRNPYSENKVSGLIPDAAALRWSTVPLIDGAGVYVFESLAIVRTAGVGISTCAPIVATEITDGDEIMTRFSALAFSTFPAGSLLFGGVRELSANFLTPFAFVAIEPNLFMGNTFKLNLKLKRVL
jgi:hypothetical protein